MKAQFPMKINGTKIIVKKEESKSTLQMNYLLYFQGLHG